MQTDPSHVSENEQRLLSLLEAFQQSAEAVTAHFHEAALIEYPYAHALGTPGRLTLSQYRTYLASALAQMSGLRFPRIETFQTNDPQVCFAEFHGHVPLPAGDYHQDYVVRATFREGKIIHYREYWNPMEANAFGDAEAAKKIFKHD
jgi:ketosteroid isomerase-like protein